MLHTKARGKYPTGVERFQVPDDKVSWNASFDDYKPVDYTAPVVIRDPKPVWADVDIR